MNHIESAIHGETTYFMAEQRGIRYTISEKKNGEWEVHSHRKALGRQNVGSYKWFSSLDEVETKYKCFAGLSALVH